MPTPAPQSGPSLNDEPPWSLLRSLLVWWIMPATAARRVVPVSLGRAFRIHLLLAVLSAAVVLVLAGWTTDIRPGVRRGLWASTFYRVGYVVWKFGREPLFTTAAATGIVVAVEAGFFFLALLATPWGARDEPMRSSLANAVRRTWLHTASFLPIALLVGTSMNAILEAELAWNNRPLPRVPHLRATSPEDYDDAIRPSWPWDRDRPWYVRGNLREPAIAYIWCGGLVWFVVGLFRSVRAERSVSRPERPPQCDTCGYNLTGASMDGRCPECGDPVMRSLGPDARPGVPWQHRAEIGLWRAWWLSTDVAIFRSRYFGRLIQLSADTRDHRLFVAMHLPAVFLLSYVGTLLCYFSAEEWGPLINDKAVALLLGPAVGVIAAGSSFFFLLLASWLSALRYRPPDGRNLLAGTTQMASYLSGYVVVWTSVAMWALAGIPQAAMWFKDISKAIGVVPGLLPFGIWLLLHLVCLGGYILLVFRGTSSLRYANR